MSQRRKLWKGGKLLVLFFLCFFLIVPLATWAGEDYETFAFEYMSPNNISLQAPLCLDVNEGKEEVRNMVQLYHCNGTDAQIWHLEGDLLKKGNLCVVAVDGNAKLQNCSSGGKARSDDDLTANKIPLSTDRANCLGVQTVEPNSRAKVISLSCLDEKTAIWKKQPMVATLKTKSLEHAVTGRVKVEEKDTLALVDVQGKIKPNFGTEEVFNSPHPQSKAPKDCTEPLSNGKKWLAKHTTYYALTPGGDFFLVNACGKSPLKRGSTEDAEVIQADAKDNEGNSIVGQLNHAVIANATEVVGAGEIDIENGVLRYIDSCSGHYRPHWLNLLRTINWLAQKKAEGIKVDGVYFKDLRYVVPNGTKFQPTTQRSRFGTGDCFSYTPGG